MLGSVNEPAARPTAPTDPATHGPEPESMVVQLQSGERLHYLQWAGGTAGETTSAYPVVLIHGLTRTGWTWLPIGRRLASAGLRVIAPDLRGHGASDAPLSGYELDSLALDMLTVAAGAGWGEAAEGPPIVAAGHGLGAMVAVEMARQQPASVAGVALLDSGWEELVEATRMLPDQLIEAMAEPPEVLASMATYLADRRDFDPATWDADQERAARAQVSERHAGHVGLVTKGSVIRRCVASMYAYQPLEALTEVGCPLSVLVAGAATADDEDERERRLALEDAARARTQAGLDPPVVGVLEGAGHDLMRYRPDEVSRALSRLARRRNAHGRGTMSPVDILLVLIVILIVVLIWRGPSMLPQFGEALGKAVKGARETMDRDAEPTDAEATSKDVAKSDDDADNGK